MVNLCRYILNIDKVTKLAWTSYFFKGKSCDAAKRLNVPAVRLPIEEFAPVDWFPQNRVKASALPLNTVVEILLTFLEHGDWRATLDHCLPKRSRTHFSS